MFAFHSQLQKLALELELSRCSARGLEYRHSIWSHSHMLSLPARSSRCSLHVRRWKRWWYTTHVPVVVTICTGGMAPELRLIVHVVPVWRIVMISEVHAIRVVARVMPTQPIMVMVRMPSYTWRLELTIMICVAVTITFHGATIFLVILVAISEVTPPMFISERRPSPLIMPFSPT